MLSVVATRDENWLSDLSKVFWIQLNISFLSSLDGLLMSVWFYDEPHRWFDFSLCLSSSASHCDAVQWENWPNVWFYSYSDWQSRSSGQWERCQLWESSFRANDFVHFLDIFFDLSSWTCFDFIENTSCCLFITTVYSILYIYIYLSVS